MRDERESDSRRLSLLQPGSRHSFPCLPRLPWFINNGMDVANLILLPRPRLVTPGEGSFLFKKGMSIACPSRPEALRHVALTLQSDIRELTGIDTALADPEAPRNPVGQIVFKHLSRDRVPAQGYRIQVAPKNITIEASYETGAFYAVMTLRQILRQCGGELPNLTRIAGRQNEGGHGVRPAGPALRAASPASG